MGGRAKAAEGRGQAAVLGEALPGCPAFCQSRAARTAGDGGGHSCFHPAGERRGRGERKASPPWPGSQAAAVLERGRGAEPPPRSARRTSPFLPLSRLYATTSRPRLSAATGRHPRSARRPVIPDALGSGKATGSLGRGPGRRPRADARPVSAAPTPAPLQQLRSPALTP